MPGFFEQMRNYIGRRDKRGIRCISERMPKSLGGMWVFVGMVQMVIGIYYVYENYDFYSRIHKLSPFYYSVLFGLSIIWLGMAAYRYHKRIDRTASVERLSSQWGVAPEALSSIIEQRGILPRYNIAGEDCYDPRDFGEAMTLLRASSSPQATEATLLRPAGTEETAPQELLRATITTSTASTTEKRAEEEKVQVQKSW